MPATTTTTSSSSSSSATAATTTTTTSTTAKAKHGRGFPCEKSTKIAVNIIRASSLLLAKIMLRPLTLNGGDTGEPQHHHHHHQVHHHQQPKHGSMKRSQAMEGAKTHLMPANNTTSSYLTDPYTTSEERQLVNGGAGSAIDRKAADYITKFHSKNKHGSSIADEVSNYIPPPPPALRKK